MGQYHKIVNLTKREFLHPHTLGDGLKLREQMTMGGVAHALHMLLACSNGRGGGDFPEDYEYVEGEKVIGRWAGDRIAIVGDYAEDTDLPPEFEASKLYDRCSPKYEEVYSDDPRDAFCLCADPNSSNFGKYRHFVLTEPPEYRDISHLVAPLLEKEFGLEFVGSGWRERKWKK